MEKSSSDHIALTLPSETIVGITGTDENSSLMSSATTNLTRKSLRRSWNQLPRCQRNLIILTSLALTVSLLLFLPGDPVVTEHETKSSAIVSTFDKPSISDNGEGERVGAGGHLPFRLNRGKNRDHTGGRRKNLGESETPEIAAAAVAAAEAQAVVEEPGRNDNSNNNNDDNKDKEQEKSGYLDNAEGDSNAIENVVHLPEMPKTEIIGEQQPNDLFINNNKVQSDNQQDLNNNIEEPAPAIGPVNEPSHQVTLDDAIREPKKLGGISVSDYLSQAQVPVPPKQHFHGATNQRQAAVVEAFKHSWSGYKKYAWGHDNLKPITQTSHDWFGLGLTIVDSLDTMYIMGLEDEFKEARDWVDTKLRFDTSRDVNLFEVTIRVLGGLLAAYHLSGDKMFLVKSVELGNRLLPSFQSPSGIPYSDVNLGDLSAHSPKWSPDSSTSEVTTIQLEFRDLSRCTNVPIYEQVVNTVNEKVHALEKNHGLVPIFINANTGTFRNYATISLGARGDSYYEYLLKQWLQTGRKDNDFLILDYMHAVDGVLTQLMRRTPKEHHVYIGELINGKDFKPKMDHLTCYFPGTLLLGHHNGMPDSHNVLANDLLETCYETYTRQPTKLAPEITYFAVNENEEQDIYVKPNDAHNLLRPEFIETLYYFYALTGERKYQDMGWQIFEAFEKHTKVSAGYTSIGNVKNVLNTRLRDMMESFWMSETLKYFYLLFSDNRKEIDLEKWVFNSEGHPLPVRQQ